MHKLARVMQSSHSSMIQTCASIDYLPWFSKRGRLASLVSFVLFSIV